MSTKLLPNPAWRVAQAVAAAGVMAGLAYLIKAVYFRSSGVRARKPTQPVRAASPGTPPPSFRHIRQSLEYRAPVRKVFGYWAAFTSYPDFMDGVQSARETDGGLFRFELRRSGGGVSIWDAVLTRLVPDQYLEWRSAEGSPIQCAGRARFRERPGSARVDLEVECSPSSGRLSGDMERFLEVELPYRLEKDLARMKDLIETGSAGI